MGAIAVSVLTGFLGSGKTTLLNALLRHPEMDETAVIVNEFGDVGLDHLLVREVVDETVVLIASGCLCCSVRSEISETLRDLHLKRVRCEVPEFGRVVIETTGLADPAPVVRSIVDDPVGAAYFRFDGIVTTFDTVNGPGQLDRHPEAVEQVALADRLVLTKTDIVDASAMETAKARLRALNPSVPILPVVMGDVGPEALFGAAAGSERWLRDAASGHAHEHHDESGISTIALSLDRPLPPRPFGEWLERLHLTLGDRILRLKGIVRVEGRDGLLAVHGMGHLLHPPVAVPPSAALDRTIGGGRLVFITRDLPGDVIEKSFSAFLAGI